MAVTSRARRRGLLGRDGINGALLLAPASVHTLGMRFPIDVAYLDRRVTGPRGADDAPGAGGAAPAASPGVLEAEAGAMARWGLRRGVRVTVRGG